MTRSYKEEKLSWRRLLCHVNGEARYSFKYQQRLESLDRASASRGGMTESSLVRTHFTLFDGYQRHDTVQSQKDRTEKKSNGN